MVDGHSRDNQNEEERSVLHDGTSLSWCGGKYGLRIKHRTDTVNVKPTVRNWNRKLLAGVIFLLCFGAYLVPRLKLGGLDSYLTAHGSGQLHVNIVNPARFIYYPLITWGIVWVTALWGLALLGRKDICYTFFLLLAGVFLSLFFAGDFGRMFAILSPVMAVGTAYLFQHKKVLDFSS